ncbi:MAG: hypothetical protein RBS43_09775, partial [Candidatus Cloacimonas sp.]|nr:hypothetical protein [Candidatus Cloacimonas sp.]
MPAPRLCLLLCLVFFSISLGAEISCDWLGHFGGSGVDEATASCFDNDGNFYVAGNFKSDFTLGSTTLTAGIHTPIFIAKFNPSGQVSWAIQSVVTGANSRTASVAGICTDAQSNIYLTGTFSPAIKLSTVSQTSSGNTDIYIAKLNSSGTCQWLNKFGGASNDVSTGICMGSDNCPVVCGYFEGSITLMDNPITSLGLTDVLAVKVDSGGVLLNYARFGGAGQDHGNAICSLALGGYAVCGYYKDSIAIGSTTLAETGQEAFICKLDNSLSPLWAVSSSGAGLNDATSICADGSSIIVAGSYPAAINFPCFNLSSDNYALYAAKLDYAGNFIWLSSLGASINGGSSITSSYLDTASILHLAGHINTNYTIPDQTIPGQSLSTTSNFDAILLTLSDSGVISSAVAYGGDGNDYAKTICGASNGTMLLAGSFSATATIAGNSYNSAGARDVFALLFHNLNSAIPAAPQNVSLARVGTNLQLSWSPVVLSQTGQTMGISGYKIYSSESPDGEDMQLCAS